MSTEEDKTQRECVYVSVYLSLRRVEGWIREMKREKHSQNTGRRNTNREEDFNWLPGEKRFRRRN